VTLTVLLFQSKETLPNRLEFPNSTTHAIKTALQEETPLVRQVIEDKELTETQHWHFCMPPKILSRSGCWTCRVRHKKCDEARPECNECTLRSLTCHGYHQKPPFIDDPDLLHLEISRIKKTVKEVYRRKRRLLLRKTASSDDQCGLESKDNGDADALSPDEAAAGTDNLDDVDGNAEAVYREAELTMYYLDRIFPILFPYCQWDPADGGRGWLFWLLSQDVPLRQAALSLAALHQRANSSGIESDETELLEYHTNALSGLRQTLQCTSEANLINDMVKLTHLMACGCSLISFEVSYANHCFHQACLPSATRYVKENRNNGRPTLRHSSPLLAIWIQPR
jgi:hypothetical protein